MKLLNDKKGQVRVIEAFFASVLLLSSLMLVPIVQRNAGNSNGVLSVNALSIMASLDSNGYLASLVDSENWSALRSSIQSCVPLALWFNVTVFDINMALLNDVPICSGSAVSDEIEAADYVCASRSANFAIYIIRLQLAAVD